MAAMTGMSSSFMGLISTLANATSSLTLDTGTHLAREFQILPGLALIGRRAQQISRVIGDDQGHGRCAKSMNLLAQSAQRLVGAKQVLRGNSPDGQHDFGFQ